MYQEITTSNIIYPATDLSCVRFDRMGAEAVFRMLLAMGATKDIKMLWNDNDGTIRIMKKFAYPAPLLPKDGEVATLYGDKFYSLQEFIKLLIKFDRATHKRLKNVEQKIHNMHSGIEVLQRQLSN